MATRSQQARMRRAYLKHRKTRVDKVGQMQLFSEARARAQYDTAYTEKLFGLEFKRFEPKPTSHYPDDCTGSTDHVRRENLREKARSFWPQSSKEKVEAIRSKLLGETTIDRHVCLVNGSNIRILLYWTIGKAINQTWFFIEVDLSLQRVRKSKRYFSREGAMRAYDTNHIVYQHIESLG